MVQGAAVSGSRSLQPSLLKRGIKETWAMGGLKSSHGTKPTKSEMNLCSTV